MILNLEKEHDCDGKGNFEPGDRAWVVMMAKIVPILHQTLKGVFYEDFDGK